MSNELRHLLANGLEGEVRFDATTRALYSTDASVYQISPLGVVIPKSTTDLAFVVEACARHRCPLTMRGGGTSQAGQSIGAVAQRLSAMGSAVGALNDVAQGLETDVTGLRSAVGTFLGEVKAA